MLEGSDWLEEQVGVRVTLVQVTEAGGGRQQMWVTNLGAKPQRVYAWKWLGTWTPMGPEEVEVLATGSKVADPGCTEPVSGALPPTWRGAWVHHKGRTPHRCGGHSFYPPVTMEGAHPQAGSG